MITNERSTSVIKKHPKSFAVAGPDLDIDLCRALSIGDKVLAEVNGRRIWSTAPAPMVDDFPWEVVSNSFERNGDSIAGELVLRHPRFQHPLVLNYARMLHNQRNEPCVFIESHQEIQSGKLQVILQMVAFYADRKTVRQIFPVPSTNAADFNERLKTQRPPVTVFAEWHEMLKKVGDGWHYNGAGRLALRAHVKLSVIHAIRRGDFAAFLKFSISELRDVWQELLWLPMLIKQSSVICHDSERTLEYRAPQKAAQHQHTEPILPPSAKVVELSTCQMMGQPLQRLDCITKSRFSSNGAAQWVLKSSR